MARQIRPRMAHPYIEKRRGHRGGRAIIAGTSFPVSSVANYYLDEDVNPLLAHDLRQRGYDALSTGEALRLGSSDRDQLDFARGEGRALLTHNRDDFLAIAREYAIKQIDHSGILYVPQVPYRALIHRALSFLAVVDTSQIRNVFVWVP